MRNVRASSSGSSDSRNGGCDRLFRIRERKKIKRDRSKDVPLFCSLMRRQGYNALRIGAIPDNRNVAAPDYQEKWLDFMDYLLAEGKKQGIYFYVNLDYGSLGKRYWNSQDRLEGRFRFIIGDPVVRGAWKRLAERLLNHVNPYTESRGRMSRPCSAWSSATSWSSESILRKAAERAEDASSGALACVPQEKIRIVRRREKSVERRALRLRIAELAEPQRYWVNNQENRDWNEFLFQCLSNLQKWWRIGDPEAGISGTCHAVQLRKADPPQRTACGVQRRRFDQHLLHHPRGGWGEAGTQYVQNSSIELAVPHFLTASASGSRTARS